ncbi:hypothetical protein, partial [Saccharopolyspora elongata]|uniref:hypothetical protein n=1 Tax=Saccharopolyspora elongata TaxID=2530387 RepID=UPI001A9D2B0F
EGGGPKEAARKWFGGVNEGVTAPLAGRAVTTPGAAPGVVTAGQGRFQRILARLTWWPSA